VKPHRRLHFNVTIVDVARKAGVSPKTVSNVVNDRPVVKPETREKVLRVIRSLEYRPSAVARSLVTRSRRMIGFILTDIKNPGFPELVEASANIARQNGFMLLLCNAGRDPNEETRFVDLLIEEQVDGVIISSSLEGSEAADTLARRGIAVVLVNRHPRKINVNFFGVENEVGGYVATRHLLSLGHRRIVHLRGEPETSTSQEREAGFRRAMQESGLPVDEGKFFLGDFLAEASREAATRFLSTVERPTAVFAANDVMAIAVIDVALQMGMRVPQDLAVVGFDDIPIASTSPIGLTTIHTDLRLISEQATHLLLDMIRDPEHPRHLDPQKHILPVALRIRRTCGALLAREAGASFPSM
jgi:DNA-binding LacI/PurR family transcriptional regulator